MDLLSVVRAPGVPFSTRPAKNCSRVSQRSRVVRCAAQDKSEDIKNDNVVKQFGRACAPFAAAVLLLAQASPATAETQFQASIRRQSEFFSQKKSGESNLDSFLKKGAEAAKGAADSATSSGPSLPFSKPDAGKAGDAVDSAKDAASDAASKAQSAAKAAAPDDATKGGKEAASNVVDAAKSVVSSSQKEAEVAGTGSSTPSGRGLTSKAVDTAKSAAGDAKDAVKETGGGNPVDTALDTAKSVAGETKSTAQSAAGGSNPVDSAVDTAKSATQDVKASNQGGGAGGGALDSAVDAAKSAAGDVAGSAQGAGDSAKGAADSAKPNFFSSFLGIDKKTGGGGSDVPPQPSDLDEKVPKNAPPLPEQPYPEPESKQLGDDNAGGKVQDTAKGSGPLDLFGGKNTGKSPESKAEELVTKAQDPNPQASFLGGIFGIDEKKDTPKPPDFGLSGTSSLPTTTNELGQIADDEPLPPPQPSEVDEAGNLPESSPGSENKLPEQPAPEPSAPEDLGKDSAGGKTGSTKSGSGPLDFFGGSSSQSSLPSKEANQFTVATIPNDNLLTFVADQLEAPQPSDFDEKLPESSPGTEIKPEEQPYPEPSSKKLPADTSGGETQDTKRGSGKLDFFGGPDTGDSEKSAEKNIEKAKSLETFAKPGQAKVSFDLQNDNSNAVAEVAEAEAVEAPEDTPKVTAIGVGLSLVLAIIIFTIQPTAEVKH